MDDAQPLLLNDYSYSDDTVDPGTLGGSPTTMPTNAWWQKPLQDVTTAIAARVAQSGGVNPPATNQTGLNRQASTTPGAGQSPIARLRAVATGPNLALVVVLVLAAVGALALVRSRR